MSMAKRMTKKQNNALEKMNVEGQKQVLLTVMKTFIAKTEEELDYIESQIYLVDLELFKKGKLVP